MKNKQNINKPTITYIKNGVEKTIIINRFNQKKILEEIYERKYNLVGYYWIDYKIKNDIELIHFKNYSFHEVNKIEIPEETICILENCIFQNKVNCHKILKLIGGSFELIDPVLINIKEINEKPANRIEDLSINITKNYNYTDYILKTKIYNNAIINIKDNNLLEDITNYSQKVTLNGNFDLCNFELLAYKEIIIGNKKEKTNIKVKDFRPLIKSNEKVNLRNCHIDINNDGIGNFEIDTPSLEVEQISLTATDEIVINNYVYNKKETEDKVVVTDSKLASTNLISILKGYRNLLEQQIKIQKEEYLKEKFSKEKKDIKNQKEKISELEQKLIEEQEYLNKLESKLETKKKNKGKAITKSLTKKQIKNL